MRELDHKGLGFSIMTMIHFSAMAASDSTADREAHRSKLRIESYIRDCGYTFESSPHPRAEWMFIVTHSADFKVGILSTRQHPGQIIIDGSMVISDEDKRGIASLPERDRLELVFAIRFKLLDYGVQFAGADDPLTVIQLGMPAFLEGLNKTTFMEKIELIVRSKLAIIWLIDRAMGRLRSTIPVNPTIQ